MRTAAAQFGSVVGDVEGNVGVMRDLVLAAAGQGARLVVFAETAVTGYAMGLLAEEPELWLTEDDPRLDPVRDACRTTSTAAVVNGAVRTADGRPAITSLVVGPDGALLARYDKRHLHGVELEMFAAGASEGRFTLDGVRIALAVCYDNRFPEIARRAREDGCRVYLASSVLEEGNDSFEAVYPVRARENGLYVVLANHVGPSEIGFCPGRSGIWGPDGELLGAAGSADRSLVVVDLPVGPAGADPAGSGAGAVRGRQPVE